jgi:hypothetical protein
MVLPWYTRVVPYCTMVVPWYTTLPCCYTTTLPWYYRGIPWHTMVLPWYTVVVPWYTMVVPWYFFGRETSSPSRFPIPIGSCVPSAGQNWGRLPASCPTSYPVGRLSGLPRVPYFPGFQSAGLIPFPGPLGPTRLNPPLLQPPFRPLSDPQAPKPFLHSPKICLAVIPIPTYST